MVTDFGWYQFVSSIIMPDLLPRAQALNQVSTSIQDCAKRESKAAKLWAPQIRRGCPSWSIQLSLNALNIHHFGMMMSCFPNISDGTFSMSTAYDICLTMFDNSYLALTEAISSYVVHHTHGLQHVENTIQNFPKQTVTCLLNEL